MNLLKDVNEKNKEISGENMPIEIEESLIICSNKQNITNLEITNHIKSWQIVDQYYDLIDKGDIIIHDIYFDTRQKNFRKKKVSFRIREINNKKLITIKIPPKDSQQRSLSLRNDEEIEFEWSKEGLLAIFKELEIRGIYTFHINNNFSFNDLDIIDTMNKLRLIIIQNRHTQRRIKNIVTFEDKNKILAEMAIEQVIYHIMENDVYHYGIEIEDKGANGSNARTFLMNELLSSKYGEILIKWKYGKISIGIGLEVLLRSKDLENKYNLSSKVYKKIENLIQNKYI
jgi:hypothetical protein